MRCTSKCHSHTPAPMACVVRRSRSRSSAIAWRAAYASVVSCVNPAMPTTRPSRHCGRPMACTWRASPCGVTISSSTSMVCPLPIAPWKAASQRSRDAASYRRTKVRASGSGTGASPWISNVSSDQCTLPASTSYSHAPTRPSCPAWRISSPSTRSRSRARRRSVTSCSTSAAARRGSDATSFEKACRSTLSQRPLRTGSSSADSVLRVASASVTRFQSAPAVGTSTTSTRLAPGRAGSSAGSVCRAASLAHTTEASSASTTMLKPRAPQHAGQHGLEPRGLRRVSGRLGHGLRKGTAPADRCFTGVRRSLSSQSSGGACSSGARSRHIMRIADSRCS